MIDERSPDWRSVCLVQTREEVNLERGDVFDFGWLQREAYPFMTPPETEASKRMPPL